MAKRARIKLRDVEKEFLREVVRRWVKKWPVEEYGEPKLSIYVEYHTQLVCYGWDSEKKDGDSWKVRSVFATPLTTTKVAGCSVQHSDHYFHYRDYDWKGGRRWKRVQSFDESANPNKPRLRHVSEITNDLEMQRWSRD